MSAASRHSERKVLGYPKWIDNCDSFSLSELRDLIKAEGPLSRYGDIRARNKESMCEKLKERRDYELGMKQSATKHTHIPKPRAKSKAKEQKLSARVLEEPPRYKTVVARIIPAGRGLYKAYAQRIRIPPKVKSEEDKSLTEEEKFALFRKRDKGVLVVGDWKFQRNRYASIGGTIHNDVTVYWRGKMVGSYYRSSDSKNTDFQATFHSAGKYENEDFSNEWDAVDWFLSYKMD